MSIVIYSALTICIIIIIFLLLNLKHNENKVQKFIGIDNKYQEVLLDNARLKEKCVKFDEVTQKYELLQSQNAILEKENVLLNEKLEQEKKNLAEKIKLLENAEKKLSDTFKALSSEALSKNNQTFIELAKVVFEKLQEKTKADLSSNTKSLGDLINPIKQALEGVGIKLGELEKSRIGAYEALKQQVGDLILSQNTLKNETTNLVSALKNPTSRGQWGEIQLHRILELSGMKEHCDFKEQVSIDNNGKNIRPDIVIYYPEGKQVVIDAKVPLTAYLKSLETTNENEKRNLLREHTKQIRNHIMSLSKKEYWSQFQPSPEFVIMFLPNEAFFSVAMEQDPNLLEFAMKENIIISTPTTLLALLHTVAWGWKQKNLAENAKQIIKLGQELYERLSNMSQHFYNLGKSINSTITNYNQTLTTLESRVLVTTRKFKELKNNEKEIIELQPIENDIKQIKN